jgi:hypothetical protein
VIGTPLTNSASLVIPAATGTRLNKINTLGMNHSKLRENVFAVIFFPGEINAKSYGQI